MKWIRISLIVLAGILAGALFAVHDQRVEADTTAVCTIDPTGNLYLLSEEGVLTKASPQGRWLWDVELPRENADGDALRYLDMISDNSGSLYLVAQVYERQVDAAGAVREIILSEEVQTWSGDGVQQDSVLLVNKTTLSQYSTQAYIRKLQMQGETLLALCCDQGRFDVIEAQPYSDEAAAILASYDLGDETAEVEDCAALSDGTLVYSTRGGGLYAWPPEGERRDLSQLVGDTCMVGQLSADESDLVYFLDRSNGVFYALNLRAYTVERLYSPEVFIDSGAELSFAQVRGTRAVGYGDFCAVSIDSENPFWVRFGARMYRVGPLRRGWGALEVTKTAAAAIGAAALMALALWLLWLAGRRWRLTGRILLRFLPAVVLVLALLAGGFAWIFVEQRYTAQTNGLAAAAKAAAYQFDGTALDLAGLRSYTAPRREELEERLERAGEYAADVSGLEDVGLILYTLEDERGYAVCASRGRDAFYTAGYLAPVNQELPAASVERILACAAEGGSVTIFRGGVAYASYFQPIQDAAGDTAGLMEARVERQSALAGTLERSPAFYACAVGAGGAAILLLWLLAVLAGSFRPLKELRRCIGEISGGNWSVQAKITSRDELADIGMSFNQMTEKLSQYISNMVLLNNEYIKFTPRELFQLMGKTKVTDLRLRDKSVRDMSLLYVSFSVDGERLDSEAYFSLMNENFDRIFDVVDINHGIIEHFDGSGMLALFPYQVRDALNTAISLKETMAREDRSVELKMLISADETLVGVAGNQKRQTITAISDTIMDIYALGSLMDEIGTRYIITRQAVERIGESFYFNCREIGAGDTGRETLYEFLDGMDPYEKKLHLVTRKSFEQGVHDYQAGRYFAARKHFAEVLQTNERDSVAMYYLMLCDTHLHEEAAIPQ